MSKDLFDETTMTFGEHLEALRVHLWRAIIGLVIAVTLSFFIAKDVLLIIQAPVTNAMRRYFKKEAEDKHLLEQASSGQTLWNWLTGKKPDPPPKPPETDPKAPQAAVPPIPPGTAASKPAQPADPKSPAPKPGDAATTDDAITPQSVAGRIKVDIDLIEFARQLNKVLPNDYPPVPVNAQPAYLTVTLTDESQKRLEFLIAESSSGPRTDSVDEAFMIYLKVAVVTGIILSSPYIFYEIWLFVAAGLYPHERKYVYVYLPMSLGLFLGGCAFCFFAVIPTVLDFLFGFNAWLELRPEMKISSWLTFVIVLPLMFGLSFQLPLVMVFLEKINLFTVQVYREKRRHAIFVIAVMSMILTPSDPVSMLMMMFPLIILYELGIILSGRRSGAKSPFHAQPA